MIKRIKGSLFAKVFILTVAVLLCVSFLVYGVLAWYMPQTYSNNLNAALDEQTSDFIYELEHIRMQDSGGLFDQFLQNTTISMVELYTADGVLVETPSNQNSFNDGITGEALGGASYESAPIISNSYYFSFADDNSQYIFNSLWRSLSNRRTAAIICKRITDFVLRYSPCIVGNCLGVFSYHYKPGIKNQSDF